MTSKSLYEMALENAKNFPDAPGFSSIDVELTHAQVVRVVAYIAAELSREGVGPGTKVATTLESSLDIFVLLAINKLGATSASAQEGAKALDNLVDFHVVKPDVLAEQVISGAKRLVAKAEWIALGKDLESADLVTAISEFHSFEDSDIVRLALTSGTTGEPKAVRLSHKALYSKSQLLPEVWFQYEKEASFFSPAAIGGLGALLCALALGREIVCVLPFSKAIVAFMIRKRIEAISGSPLQIVQFLDATEELGLGLGSLQKVRLAGGPVSEALVRRLRKHRIPGVTSHYGSTEVGGLFVRDLLSDEPLNYLGTSYQDKQFRLVGEPKEEISLSRIGLLEYKSSYMFSGYLMSDGSIETGLNADGYFASGDLVEEISGKYIFRGREDDIQNIGGVSINALPIEVYAKTQAGIEDAACFAITDPKGKTWFAMAIIAEPDYEISTLADALNKQFPSSSPRYISKVNAIPRTETGKPIRRELVALFENRVFQTPGTRKK